MSVQSVGVSVTSSTLIFNLSATFPSGVEWFIGVVGPYGTIKALPNPILESTTPDLDGNTGQVLVTPTDPLDAGEYVFTIVYWDKFELNGDRAVQQTITYTFCYEPLRQFVLGVSDDCVNLRVQDLTSYPANTAFTRSMVVRYPEIPKLQTPPDVTYTVADVDHSLAHTDSKIYEFVTWVVTGESSGTFQEVSGVWTITYMSTYQQDSVNHEVLCNLDLCGAIACMDTWWTEIRANLCNMNGWQNLPTATQTELFQLLGDINMFNYYVNCNDTTNARIYYNRVKEVIGDTCADEVPKVATSPSPYSNTWTLVPQASMSNLFEPDPTDPLAFKFVNGVCYFKGKFLSGTWTDAGVEFIKPAFFTDLGITISNGGVAVVVDAVAGANPLGVGVAFPNTDNALYIRKIQAAIDTASDFSIASSFAI